MTRETLQRLPDRSIDYGYGNIKTANTVTPTDITKLYSAPTFTKNTLFFEGRCYQIGEVSVYSIEDSIAPNDK